MQSDLRTKWWHIQWYSCIIIDYGQFMMIYKPSKLVYTSVHIDRVYHFSCLPLYPYVSFNGPQTFTTKAGFNGILFLFYFCALKSILKFRTLFDHEKPQSGLNRFPFGWMELCKIIKLDNQYFLIIKDNNNISWLFFIFLISKFTYPIRDVKENLFSSGGYPLSGPRVPDCGFRG